MNQNVTPLFPMLPVRQVDGAPHRETEREMFDRLAANMRDDRRRARRAERHARARRLLHVGQPARRAA
jgi:hypothetical protein